MIWTVVCGAACLMLGFIVGTNAGRDAILKQSFVGYYDVSTRSVYFDPKADDEAVNEKEYTVLETVDLGNKINACKED